MIFWVSGLNTPNDMRADGSTLPLLQLPLGERSQLSPPMDAVG